MMIDHLDAFECDGMHHYFAPECEEPYWRADPHFYARPTTNGAIGTWFDVWVHIVPRLNGKIVQFSRAGGVA